MEHSMTPSRPYLMRALNEWILDNHCTPYVLVDAGIQGVQVPQDYVNNGQIVLNISPSAVQNLLINQDGLSFSARFGGVCRWMCMCLLLLSWRFTPGRMVKVWCLVLRRVLRIRISHLSRQYRITNRLRMVLTRKKAVAVRR